jgi:hypothetical protein
LHCGSSLTAVRADRVATVLAQIGFAKAHWRLLFYAGYVLVLAWMAIADQSEDEQVCLRSSSTAPHAALQSPFANRAPQRLCGHPLTHQTSDVQLAWLTFIVAPYALLALYIYGLPQAQQGTYMAL